MSTDTEPETHDDTSVSVKPDGSPAEPETPRKSRNGYLPVLPEGWSYAVNIAGPGGRVGVYEQRGGDAAPWVVQVDPKGGGTTRNLPAESLADGIRLGTEAVKALARLAKVEEEYAAARRAAMASLGEDPTDGD